MSCSAASFRFFSNFRSTTFSFIVIVDDVNDDDVDEKMMKDTDARNRVFLPDSRRVCPRHLIEMIHRYLLFFLLDFFRRHSSLHAHFIKLFAAIRLRNDRRNNEISIQGRNASRSVDATNFSSKIRFSSSLDQRKQEAEKIRLKYPERIPVRKFPSGKNLSSNVEF